MTPEPWELNGQPGDIIALGVMSLNVFALSEQDITVSDLSLREWWQKTGRSYTVHQLEGRVCVTITVVAGDRVSVSTSSDLPPRKRVVSERPRPVMTALCWCGHKVHEHENWLSMPRVQTARDVDETIASSWWTVPIRCRPSWQP